jgi:hypothetical protein
MRKKKTVLTARAIDVVARQIKKECSKMKYMCNAYKQHMSEDIAGEHIPSTLELSLPVQSLSSIFIGNIVTSAVKKHPTPLEIALGVYLHKKKLINHMHDYLVSYSYDEVLHFKHSSASAKYYQITNSMQVL